ncbi:thiosulfate sulfurtransferase/rhodanese-like domain-containing protein 3 isoform X1 [Orussus abietinus]|uniref:thiosulfate sulfurtransferase/rhodanese-like domain-containing protein 3 isoform X1 n=1 Tax=Orussus abietinus TaxID=222816 RepID=UPI00062578ED|nr:thiosulfate sulfurtransferase/rhodanese-like domain-containing protein 3 isoform X1 [Orussus abietinus]
MINLRLISLIRLSVTDSSRNAQLWLRKSFHSVNSVHHFSKLQMGQRNSTNLGDAFYKINCLSNTVNSLFSNSANPKACTKIVHGEGDCKTFDISYEELLKAQKDDSVLLIDVREQVEINETGKLPGSVHIPMGNVANLITSLSDEEFKNKFLKPKPSKQTKIILSCKMGRRSATVQEELKQMGYNAYNYTGGWLEWESRQKQ